MPGPAPLGGFESRLEGAVASFREQHRVPGIVAGVVLDQDLVWSGSVGYADLETGSPMDDTRLFRIASITKTLVATAIMQLRDEGRLSLDDPLVEHVPEFAVVRDPFGQIHAVTLRGLLTHTSGLQYVAPPAAARDPHANDDGFVTRERVLERLDRTAIVIPPGTWKYSNLAYELLGEVVRRVGGPSLGGYVTAHILGPLGMGSTTFEPGGPLSDRCAIGYRVPRYEESQEPARRWPGGVDRAAGGLWSDVRDMATWVSQQFRTDSNLRRGAGQVLAGASLAEMHRATVLKDPAWSYAQGIGWASIRRGELIVTSHSGGVPGWRANVLFHAGQRFGVVVLLNSHEDAPGLGLKLAEIVWPVARDRRSSSTITGIPQPAPEHLRPYLGSYTDEDEESTVRVEWQAGELVLVNRPLLALPGTIEAHPLLASDRDDAFLAPTGECAGEEVVFGWDVTGRVTSLVLGGERFTRLGSVEPQTR
jgi:D-alanyl-D-alanine carboxypeptidase